MGLGEAEDEDDDLDSAPVGGISPADTGDGDGLTDPLRPGSAASITTGGPRGKKRKRVTRQKGGDFWTMVDKWFSARMTAGQFGPAWNSPGWRT